MVHSSLDSRIYEAIVEYASATVEYVYPGGYIRIIDKTTWMIKLNTIMVNW